MAEGGSVRVGTDYPSWSTLIKYQGVFVLRPLYKEIMEFMKDLDYTDEERFHYWERYFYEKHSNDPNEGKTMWVWLRGKKIDGPDVSQYYYFYINIDFTVRFLKDVEVMKDGEKFKAQSGYIEIFLDSGVVVDRHGKWSEHWLLKHLHDFYFHRIWYKQLEDKKHMVKDDALKLMRMIKQYLDLESFLPLKGETFVPSHGYRESQPTGDKH